MPCYVSIFHTFYCLTKVPSSYPKDVQQWQGEIPHLKVMETVK